MIIHTIGAIRREFNRQPQEAIIDALEKLCHIEKLNHNDQMELVGLFARAATQGLYGAVSAAGCLLEEIAPVGRKNAKVAPQLYNTLLNLISHANVDEWVAARTRADVILKADLTAEEKTSLVDALVGSKELRAAVEGASRVLSDASETRISLTDAKKLADVLRLGLADESFRSKDTTLESIIQVLRQGQMRGKHCVILEDLAKDTATALRSGKVTTEFLSEDSRAFLNRILALTVDGPVPVYKPEPARHGITFE